MKWCCLPFRDHFGEAGNRGFAVFAVRADDGQWDFVFQHRAADVGCSPPEGYSSPLAFVSDVLFRYCPWCGVELAQYYRNNADEMNRPDLKVRFD
jgi:hypothetical protein